MGIFAYTWKTFAREITMMVVAGIWWIPFYFLVIVALKPDREVFTSPLTFPSELNFNSFGTAWAGSAGVSMSSAMVNSVQITVGAVLLLVAFGAPCAYVIARHASRLTNGLFMLFVLGIILPYQLAVVPSYVVFRALGLVPSNFGLIILYAGLLMPMAVFMFTGFVRALPIDYEEAARVDGAGNIGIFVKIVLPLMSSITATVAILTGLIVWNDFFLQLVFLGGSKSQTLPVQIYSFVGEFISQWNLMFAAVLIAIAPVLVFFVIAQRQLVRGFSGGLKG